METAYQYWAITAHQRSPESGVEIRLARLDRPTNRMVFASVVDLLGALDDPRDAADLLAYGAEVARLRVHEECRGTH